MFNSTKHKNCILRAAVLSVCGLILSTAISLPAYAENENTIEDSVQETIDFSLKGMGETSTKEDLIVAEEDLFINDEPDSVLQVTALPSSVDWSTSEYFPEIGDQGIYGSCSAFATTYYQFTFQANKSNGITTTSDAIIILSGGQS